MVVVIVFYLYFYILHHGIGISCHELFICEYWSITYLCLFRVKVYQMSNISMFAAVASIQVDGLTSFLHTKPLC